MQYIVLVAAVMVASACLVSATRPNSAKDRLTQDLLKNYQPSVDPGNIELSFAVAFLCSRHDRLTGSVVSNVWEKHFWQDSRLSWSPSEYAGLESIRVPAKHIWTPDTRAHNSISSLVERDDVNVVINSNGQITWIPTATYRFLCQGNDSEATCSTRIGSWSYDGNNIDLKAYGVDPFDLSNYNPACPSVITSHTAEVVAHKYPCCDEPYPSLDVTFTLKPRMKPRRG